MSSRVAVSERSSMASIALGQFDDKLDFRRGRRSTTHVAERAIWINRANRYENSSLITRPPLAIFMGRPLRLVKVVESGIPSAFSTEAITSCEL